MINWEKYNKYAVQIMIDEVEEVYDGIFKELEVAREAKQLNDFEFAENLPLIIKRVYGSLDAYADHIESMKYATEKQLELVDHLKFSLLEKITIKALMKKGLKSWIKPYKQLEMESRKYALEHKSD